MADKTKPEEPIEKLDFDPDALEDDMTWDEDPPGTEVTPSAAPAAGEVQFDPSVAAEILGHQVRIEQPPAPFQPKDFFEELGMRRQTKIARLHLLGGGHMDDVTITGFVGLWDNSVFEAAITLAEDGIKGKRHIVRWSAVSSLTIVE